MMQFDAFISYSSTDKVAAFAACAVMERAGVRCWIAPRDITPGVEYGAAIIDAIEQCRVMVLIFSSSANNSRQITREIERAVSKGVAIVPVRIEAVEPTKSMEYFLGAIHWLDALTPPIEQHLENLAETVKAILRVDASARAATPALPGDLIGNGTASGNAGQRKPAEEKTPAAMSKPPARSNWAAAALGIAACAVAILGGAWFYLSRPTTPKVAAVAPAPSPAPVAPAPSPPQPAPRQTVTLVPEKVPFVRDRDHEAIRTEYLPAPDHKALAISFNRIGFTTGQPDDETAKTVAMASCTRATEATGAKNPCSLYAVGSTVVFAGGNPPMPPAPWHIRNPAIERPFVAKELPLVGDGGRDHWQKTYTNAGKIKTLEISPSGRGFYYNRVASTDEAIRRALESCGYLAGVPCMIVAIDDSFVVPIPTTMKVTGFLHLNSHPAISAEVRETLMRRFGNATNAWNAIAIGANGRAGSMLNAANEQSSIDGALADCNKQDRDCRVISIGPFLVEKTASAP